MRRPGMTGRLVYFTRTRTICLVSPRGAIVTAYRPRRARVIVLKPQRERTRACGGARPGPCDADLAVALHALDSAVHLPAGAWIKAQIAAHGDRGALAFSSALSAADDDLAARHAGIAQRVFGDCRHRVGARELVRVARAAPNGARAVAERPDRVAGARGHIACLHRHQSRHVDRGRLRDRDGRVHWSRGVVGGGAQGRDRRTTGP